MVFAKGDGLLGVVHRTIQTRFRGVAEEPTKRVPKFAIVRVRVRGHVRQLVKYDKERLVKRIEYPAAIVETHGDSLSFVHVVRERASVFRMFHLVDSTGPLACDPLGPRVVRIERANKTVRVRTELLQKGFVVRF